MPRLIVAACVAVAALAACSRGPKLQTPAPGERPLAGYATQRVALTPVAGVRVDSLGWVRQLGGAATAARRLDSALVAALAERDVAQSWVLPSELARAYERNRSYATDPYRLTVDPLRAPTFVATSRFGEPLASQLRTLIALHDDTRLVLVPVELRFERASAGDPNAGRGILRVALLDPRFAEARWVGEVQGDTTNAPLAAVAGLAARFANLFLAP